MQTPPAALTCCKQEIQVKNGLAVVGTVVIEGVIAVIVRHDSCCHGMQSFAQTALISLNFVSNADAASCSYMLQ